MQRRTLGISTFNLIELLVVLVLAAILFNITVPAYNQMTMRNRVQNAALQIAMDINWARQLSLKYEDTIYVSFATPTTYSIYKSTFVPGTSYGNITAPFLSRNLDRDFPRVQVSCTAPGNIITFAVDSSGAILSAPGNRNYFLRRFPAQLHGEPNGENHL
jgi:prepilin-type N-terminal cleavage/methylation domain-containing protein